MIINNTAAIIISVITALIASSGFWAFVMSRNTQKSATVRLIMGLGYSKAIELGIKYIEKGYVTDDELADYRKFLYEPYVELGGNGVVERIMNEVMALPIKHHKTDFIVDIRKRDRA
jgi:hypothetical protein